MFINYQMKLTFLLCCFIFTITFGNLLQAESYKWILNENLKWSSMPTGISNADSSNIMLCGDNGYKPPKRQILKSTDGGITWQEVFSDYVMWYNKTENIAYPTKDFCIVTCDSNYITKTTDGGKTWENKLIDIEQNLNGFVHISLLDSLYGILGTYSKVVYSDDGFKTYKLIKLPRSLSIRSIQIISPKKIYILSGQPDFFFQYDLSSDIWSEVQLPVYTPDYNIPFNMFFLDSLYGFISGSRSTGTADSQYDMIHKTTDGGKSWVEKLNAFNQPIFGLDYIKFCDKENGIAVGQFGKIYWTHDSGNTWIQDYAQQIIDSQPPVMHVVMLHKYTAVLATFEGNIWRSSFITDIEEENNIEVPIYPNPAESYIYINLPLEFLTEKMKIYSVEGILVYQTSDILKMSDVSAKIDVSCFPAGVYYVKVGDRVCRFVKI